MNIKKLAIIAATVAGLLAVWAPAPSASADVNVYTTPGYHTVNGREWRTTCEQYTVEADPIFRCRAEIKATQITRQGNRYVSTTGWVFNNLSYLPSARTKWTGNPLATTGEFTSSGRKWKTSCGDDWTGPNACRSFIWSSVIESYIGSNGARQYVQKPQWVFNNVVYFLAENAQPPAPPVTTPPTPPATPKPTPPPATTPPSADYMVDAADAALECMNAARAKRNLTPMRFSAPLMKFATDWSTEMSKSGKLQHSDKKPGFRESYPDVWAFGENVGAFALRPEPADVFGKHVCQSWLNSPQHVNPIMNPAYNETGVGLVADSNGVVWATQVSRDW